MNLYIIVEGRSGERRLYPEWIRHINDNLRQIFKLDEFTENCYYLISGNGYPNYKNVIDLGIEDLHNHPEIDYLVIAVDSEDKTSEEMKLELIEYINERINADKVRIIIQHPCLEAWALGNKIVCRRNPKDRDLRRYLRIFDVREKDPELIPPLESENLNRCQFAFVYLKRMLYDRYPNLIYTKANPRVIAHIKYFRQIKKRYEEDHHILSFSDFLRVFT